MYVPLAASLMMKGSGRHGADAARLCCLDIQHDPCRAYALAPRSLCQPRCGASMGANL